MKLRPLVFVLVLGSGALGLVRDVVTHGDMSAKDALMLALGAHLDWFKVSPAPAAWGRKTQVSLQRQLQRTALR